jgi:hypothetical protein
MLDTFSKYWLVVAILALSTRGWNQRLLLPIRCSLRSDYLPVLVHVSLLPLGTWKLSSGLDFGLCCAIILAVRR